MSILKIKDSQGNWVGVPTVKGDTGNGISSAVLNDDYTLTLTFTDGTTYTTPSIRGEKGEQGDPASSMNIHICSSNEYDAETRIPTIANPNDKTFYLVPTEDGTSPDLFTEWVYVNGAWEMFGSASVDLTDYVKNTDYATDEIGGVIKVSTSKGLAISSNGTLETSDANVATLKDGTDRNSIVSARRLAPATFYGLAKASGDSTQSASSNPVGTYTNEAKASIKNMLGIQDNMVVTVEQNETSDWQADKTFVEIRNALIKGKNVIVNDDVYLLPYVGQLYQNNILWFAFGISTVFNNTNVLYGYLIGDNNGQTIVTQINQNTPIPQINDLTTGSDTVWSSNKINTELGNKIDDVQINGTSIVTDGVANIPYASNSQAGVSFVNDGIYGIKHWNKSTPLLVISTASSGYIQTGTSAYKPITPSNQHNSTFYGLAKAAGDTTQSQSSNAVGSYTEDAKSKISEMLGGSVSVSGTTPTITAKSGIRYVCGEVSTLDITVPASGIIDVVFTSGSTATVLTVTPPTGMTMKWANGFDPTSLEANTVYEINILDGIYGAVMAWT